MRLLGGFSNTFIKGNTMENKMQWFVVNVHTGCEDKVARNLREQIDKRRLNAYFGEILVPTREVTEIKAGKRVKTEKKFFPGYIVVQMIMNNETFSLVKLMPQVVMFLGARQKPVAVSEEEARRLLKQVEEGSTVPDDMVYEVGQEVHVIDGPFANFNGVVSEVDNVKQKMTVTISVFGRATNVDLEFDKVERV
jgi:transcriptional antiterminator NusG